MKMKLPSGADFEAPLATFEAGKALYQAMLEEAKNLKLDPNTEIDVNFYKDIFCLGLASKKIEACIWECMKKATYNGLRIDKDTFEPESAREDYFTVCFEVAKLNILPFTKSLSVQYGHILGQLKTFLS